MENWRANIFSPAQEAQARKDRSPYKEDQGFAGCKEIFGKAVPVIATILTIPEQDARAQRRLDRGHCRS